MTPARVRGGFGTYFVDGFHEDHWITEYLLPDGSWRLVDPQVLHPAYGDLGFDPLDVPRDRFLVAGEAWRACRAGAADPQTFGLWSVESLRGMWFVRDSLVLDLACRGGVETLPRGRRRLYTEPRLAPPREILARSPGLGPRRVTLAQR
ncbi:hypothetical protein AB5J49_37320 [Streptomyces sp. R28]|uniref:Transglutaminase-like domain-containing protein n=1 Tax=Streptomyces sp. R28 TaxID=3238628 RepID=A0AB39Q5M7_9ACTN